MEMQKIESYLDLIGIRLLQGLGALGLVLGGICFFMMLWYWLDFATAGIFSEDEAYVTAWIVTQLTGVVFVVAASCLALSTIARSAVSRRDILKQE